MLAFVCFCDQSAPFPPVLPPILAVVIMLSFANLINPLRTIPVNSCRIAMVRALNIGLAIAFTKQQAPTCGDEVSLIMTTTVECSWSHSFDDWFPIISIVNYAHARLIHIFWRVECQSWGFFTPGGRMMPGRSGFFRFSFLPFFRFFPHIPDCLRRLSISPWSPNPFSPISPSGKDK